VAIRWRLEPRREIYHATRDTGLYVYRVRHNSLSRDVTAGFALYSSSYIHIVMNISTDLTSISAMLFRAEHLCASANTSKSFLIREIVNRKKYRLDENSKEELCYIITVYIFINVKDNNYAKIRDLQFYAYNNNIICKSYIYIYIYICKIYKNLIII